MKRADTLGLAVPVKRDLTAGGEPGETGARVSR